MNPQPVKIRLSPRQRQICDYLAEGWTDKEMAAALGISESTVDFHLRQLFAKFGVHSRAAVGSIFTLRESVGYAGQANVRTFKREHYSQSNPRQRVRNGEARKRARSTVAEGDKGRDSQSRCNCASREAAALRSESSRTNSPRHHE